MLKSLLQYHSSKASVLQHSAFFTIQLSYPYMMYGKTIALTIWTFVVKVMSLLSNMLSRFVIAYMSSDRYPVGETAGEGNGTLLQYFCLENPMDGGAW